MFKQDEYMLRIFLHHINKGSVWPDAIGERIWLAVEKYREDDPKQLWVLYNLSALYWRVIGENVHALECLRRGIIIFIVSVKLFENNVKFSL